MSVRRKVMGRAEGAARRAVGPDPTDEPRLKFLSSNGEPPAVAAKQVDGEEADMSDGTGLYTIQEIAQQEFDRLVQEAAAPAAYVSDGYGPGESADPAITGELDDLSDEQSDEMLAMYSLQDEGPVDSDDNMDSL